MAYQNVSTPRFYVNASHFMISNNTGNINPEAPDEVVESWDNGVAMLNIGEDYEIPNYGVGRIDFPVGDIYNFVFVLGHNMQSAQTYFYLVNSVGTTVSPVSNVNGDIGSPPDYNGWGLQIFNDQTDDSARLHISSTDVGIDYTKIKSVCVGRYFDMPHSPDLNLTMTREYGGIKTIETKGGASLSNDSGSSPPKWGSDMEAWQLGDKDFSVGGRRIWDLSFSYLSDSSVFPDNPTEIADAGGWEVDEATPDFMSEVIKKTRGSMLPFIFQPNTDDDIFAICKFDSGFSFQQTAPNLYSVKMRIREVW